MKIFIFLLVAALCAYSATAIVCTEGICGTVRCAEADCAANQKFVAHGGFCGCCDACITELEEGDSCLSVPPRGVPPTSECRAPLTCIDGKCGQA